jgi:hypothetical protein
VKTHGKTALPNRTRKWALTCVRYDDRCQDLMLLGSFLDPYSDNLGSVVQDPGPNVIKLYTSVIYEFS